MQGLQTIIDGVTKWAGSLNALSLNIFSYIAKSYSLASWSADLVKFILQFIPPPILLMINVELIFAVASWFIEVFEKFKVMIKLPGT